MIIVLNMCYLRQYIVKWFLNAISNAKISSFDDVVCSSYYNIAF